MGGLLTGIHNWTHAVIIQLGAVSISPAYSTNVSYDSDIHNWTAQASVRHLTSQIKRHFAGFFRSIQRDEVDFGTI